MHEMEYQTMLSENKVSNVATLNERHKSQSELDRFVHYLSSSLSCLLFVPFAHSMQIHWNAIPTSPSEIFAENKGVEVSNAGIFQICNDKLVVVSLG